MTNQVPVKIRRRHMHEDECRITPGISWTRQCRILGQVPRGHMLDTALGMR